MITCSKKKSSAGFTLIELAISTVIVGILFATVAYPFSVWQEKKKYEITVDNVEQMAWGVSAYRVANGHYPCPAAMNVPRNDPKYGRSTVCTDVAAVADNSCDATEGYCTATSPRVIENVDADGDGTLEVNANGALNPGQDDEFRTRVRIGGIPFRELNIPEDQAYDAYGNRILYAVTETLAYSQTPLNVKNHKNNPQAGGINVVYNDGGGLTSRLDIPDSANFVVLSHGEDRFGAINRDGNIVSACNEAAPDGQNCDHLDGAGINNIFYVSERVETNDNNQHDDLVLYQMPLNAPLWARSVDNPSNIYSIPSEENPDGRVGSDFLYNYHVDVSKTLDPVEYQQVYENARLWVGGNILADYNGVPDGTTGQVQASRICDRDGLNCFPAAALGGVDPGEGIECPPGAVFMRGVRRDVGDPATQADDISDDSIVGECQSLINFQCPPNQYVRSITNGRLDCLSAPCVAKTVTICGQNFNLPNAESGQIFSFRAGDIHQCGRGTFTCSGGVWNDNLNESLCACVPLISPSSTQSCPLGCTGGPLVTEEVTDCVACNVFSRTTGTCNCPCQVTGTCPPDPNVCGPCTPGTTGGSPCGPGQTGLTQKTVTTCAPHPVCTQTAVTPATCAPIGGGGTGDPPCTGGVGAGC